MSIFHRHHATPGGLVHHDEREIEVQCPEMALQPVVWQAAECLAEIQFDVREFPFRMLVRNGLPLRCTGTQSGNGMRLQ